MNEKDFIRLVKNAVVMYSNENMKRGTTITTNDVYIVWICKTLQNSKALAATTLNDSMYYEVTYNGDKHEAYVDAYIKESNFVIGVDQ